MIRTPPLPKTAPREAPPDLRELLHGALPGLLPERATLALLDRMERAQ